VEQQFQVATQGQPHPGGDRPYVLFVRPQPLCQLTTVPLLQRDPLGVRPSFDSGGCNLAVYEPFVWCRQQCDDVCEHLWRLLAGFDLGEEKLPLFESVVAVPLPHPRHRLSGEDRGETPCGR